MKNDRDSAAMPRAEFDSFRRRVWWVYYMTLGTSERSANEIRAHVQLEKALSRIDEGATS